MKRQEKFLFRVSNHLPGGIPFASICICTSTGCFPFQYPPSHGIIVVLSSVEGRLTAYNHQSKLLITFSGSVHTCFQSETSPGRRLRLQGVVSCCIIDLISTRPPWAQLVPPAEALLPFFLPTPQRSRVPVARFHLRNPIRQKALSSWCQHCRRRLQLPRASGLQLRRAVMARLAQWEPATLGPQHHLSSFQRTAERMISLLPPRR